MAQFLTDENDLRNVKDQLQNDPHGIGLTFVEADDAANAAKMNNEPKAAETTLQLRVDTVDTTDIWEACDPLERQGLTDRQYRDFQTIIQFGQIFPAKASDTVATLKSFFAPSSISRPKLDALLYRDGSLAELMYQDGLLSHPHYMTPSDIAFARNVPDA